uniref:Endoribonuclease n=1 Tax=Loa loa TaxID=7209 RepID=A0A1I7W2U8_LOALO
MVITVWYVSFLYLIAILSDILDGTEKVPGNNVTSIPDGARYQKLQEFLVLDSEVVNMVNELRQYDSNKLDDEQIILDYQEHMTSLGSGDKAKRRLFKWIDPNALKRNTFRKWIALSDEYQPEVGIEEKNTPKKKKAIDDYLDAILNTTVWKSLYQFLLRKGYPYSNNMRTFRAWIKQLWFEGYSRKQGFIDSSGFEHVFMGENNLIIMDIPLNDLLVAPLIWIIRGKGGADNEGELNILAVVQFNWGKYLKRTGSFFLGTSPEFDLALYTLCFITRRSNNICKFQLNECPFFITSYSLMQKGKNFVGSVYPIPGPFTDKCRRYNS